MHVFVTPVLCGVAVTVIWLAIWAAALRAFGILVLSRIPEERTHRRERLSRMGKLRYILIFGVFGNGLGLGLGITTASLMEHVGHNSWGASVAKVVLLSLLGGWFNGARTWNEAVRNPVRFPPDYAALR
jgi:hypothetical protein